MQNKIAFVIPYFGKLPSYFSLFAASVKDKPLDILFFTDIEKPKDLPNNLVWMQASIGELASKFSEKLGVEVALAKPYKLCDLKPFYGYLFEEYLSDYDFWGSIDTDIVLGNFSHFINDAVLDEIDVYSGIKGYVSGSFFLVRNNRYCNTLFKKSKDWKSIVKNAEYCCFDECGGFYFEPLKAGKNILELNIPIQSFTEVIIQEGKNGLRTLFTDVILETGGLIPVKIKDNTVWFESQEYLLVHFIYFKMKYYFYINKSISSKTYFINDFGTFKKSPSYFTIAFSKNMVYALNKKIAINAKKLISIKGLFEKKVSVQL